MDGITEFAILLKERENGADYAPRIGRITELSNLKIRLSERVTLTAGHIKKSCIDLFKQDEYGQYVNLYKDVLLLPYGGNQKYIVIGVVLDVS